MSKKILFLVCSLIFFTFLTPVFAVGKPENASYSSQFRSCSARENTIKTRLINLTTFAENMAIKFDAIANKVKLYYTTTVLPNGKSINNYDSLVENIKTNKDTVTTTLTKAQNDANNFTCSETDPLQQMEIIREDMQTVKQALKDYRSAIKNLIVAIRPVSQDQVISSPSAGENN